MNEVRIEIDGPTDLASVYRWLSQRRGQVIELDTNRRLALGVPISGARAVIVAALLQDDTRPGPQLGGVVRALSSQVHAAPVRLAFEGRSPSGLSPEDAQIVAAGVLDAITQQIESDEMVANVA